MIPLLRCGAFASVAILLAFAGIHPAMAERMDIAGPVGSVSFGAQVVPLPNGNFVVNDPGYNAPGPIPGAGAVYLFAPNGEIISTLTGAHSGDNVGRIVVALSNGDFVVGSPDWRDGAAIGVGAVTWVDGRTGLNGVVSGENSLIGSTAGDRVGDRVVALTNGNYIVLSPDWRNSGQPAAGAITWGSGAGGTQGVVSVGNSLVGSKANDRVGGDFPLELANGNYLVGSGQWNGGVGAVTWFPGGQVKAGVLSSANSLVGTGWEGSVGLTALPNGNYFVQSPSWSSGGGYSVGALTWGDGASGTTGEISGLNSLIGSTAGDGVGQGSLIIVGGSNVVLTVPNWDNGSVVDAGAVVWASGDGGTVGPLSASNALVGSTADDQVGVYGPAAVEVLDNGHYFVGSPHWDRGAIADAGAVTWGSGISGVRGPISLANSLLGAHPSEYVGTVRSLRSGNAVATSSLWDNGASVDAGAVTWLSGTSPTTGEIGPANSLVGTRPNDRVGLGGIEPLSNGHYVVLSPEWNSLAAASVGAVTWCDGFSGRVGSVASTNSLIGTNPADQVGNGGALALTNGNFVVRSSLWNNEVAVDVGAITWGDGTAGVTGQVSAANSFVGNSVSSPIGTLTPLSTGGYVLISSGWDGPSGNVGAVTWSDGMGPLTGSHNVANSLTGESANDLFTARVFDLGGGQFLLSAPRWDVSGTSDVGALREISAAEAASGLLCGGKCQRGLGAQDFFGEGEIVTYPDGYFVLPSRFFNHAGLQHVGALTFGRRGISDYGPITPANTLIGDIQFGFSRIEFARFEKGARFVVSGHAPNEVVLFDWALFADGFE